MKKIIPVFAILLLAGCVCPFLLGGSKDVLELVPKSANLVILVRASAILNDSDLSSLYNSNGGSSFSTQKIESTTGIDLTKIDKVALFEKVNSLKSTGDDYDGFIARGTMDKNTILNKMRVNNDVTQISYGGQDLYELSPKDSSTSSTSYAAFLDGSTLVVGTRGAVEDSIDTNAGKIDNVKTRQNISQTYDALDKNSLIIILMDIPSQMKGEIGQSLASQPNYAALSEINCLGLSVVKNNNNLNIKILATAEDSASASDVSDALDTALTTIKGVVPATSTIATVAKKITVDTKGATVTISLSTTPYEITQLTSEFSQLSGSGGSQGTGSSNTGSGVQGIILPG